MSAAEKQMAIDALEDAISADPDRLAVLTNWEEPTFKAGIRNVWTFTTPDCVGAGARVETGLYQVKGIEFFGLPSDALPTAEEAEKLFDSYKQKPEDVAATVTNGGNGTGAPAGLSPDAQKMWDETQFALGEIIGATPSAGGATPGQAQPIINGKSPFSIPSLPASAQDYIAAHKALTGVPSFSDPQDLETLAEIQKAIYSLGSD